MFSKHEEQLMMRYVKATCHSDTNDILINMALGCVAIMMIHQLKM